MILGLCLIAITGLLWGAIGVLHSIVARRRLRYLAFRLINAGAAAAVAAVAYVRWGPLLEGKATRTGELVGVIGLSITLNVIAYLLVQRAMRQGHHAGTWTIAQSAMLFPFAAAVLLWQDTLTAFRIAGIGSILAGVCVFGRGRALVTDEASRGSGGAWFAPALIAFVLLGAQQTTMQMPSYWAGWEDVANLRVPILLAVATFWYLVLTAWTRTWPTRRELTLGLIGAAVGIVSSICLFAGMDRLSARGVGAVVYPMATGISILTFAAYSLVVLREPTSRYHWIGLACCIAGIVVIAL